jgi:hypothetical protein
MSRPDSSWNHDSLDPDTITARATVRYATGSLDSGAIQGLLRHQVRPVRAQLSVAGVSIWSTPHKTRYGQSNRWSRESGIRA